MCMGSVNVGDSPYIYIFTSKVHYYIMGAHLLYTNYIDYLLLKVKILNRPDLAYKWFYGMLMEC